ncbi:MAG: J domain-containing protein [Nostoc sp. NMS7]|uniref:J domain-containing protein n=1 Tax=Nostoc sp. NMS7 TaxID=2815391 RepID=UPI0025F2CB72|nr:J domain-containing protein [Nostoc sp. NMS7]MBN3948429.1 J domain-containing protein [Nostoc sp. NMS7]
MATPAAGIAPFTPTVEFLENPIALADDDLKWTERFRSGVFCFFENQLGISFKNAHTRLEFDVERKYCGASPKVHKNVRNITCRIPILPGTFQPISAPAEQVELMRRLLEGAFIVEELLEAEATHHDDIECDRIRDHLNQFYDSFVPEFGLLVNCNSYYDGLWPDVRLEIYLSQLTDSAGNKSDIFRKRINHPPVEATGQQFFEEDLETRLTNAFSWCMGWFGEVVLDEIAEKSGVDCDRALEILQKLELVYRHWIGIKTENWWELLEVDADIDSAFELKMAYREKVKFWHPDINSFSHATKMMQLVNDAYEKAATIVSGRSPRVALRDHNLTVNFIPKVADVVVNCGKHLGVCEVPKDKPSDDKQFALIELTVCRCISFFSSITGALSCLKELEPKYIDSWHRDHPDHDKYQQITKFYR